MPLREEMEKQGAFLFKWRSYLPILAIPLLLIVFRDSAYTKRLFGDPWDNFWELFSLTVSFLGLAVRALVAGYVPRGTSGRNTQTQVAETLNTKGMYSIVRNPLYLGNYLMILGIMLFTQVWWFVFLGTILFWAYYERIIFTEEEFLRQKFGKTFVEWAEKTPLAWPRFKNWQKPDTSLSWKTILRREHSSFFGMVCIFTLLGIAADLFIEHSRLIDLFWLLFFAVGLVLYLVLRFLKKKTHFLDIEGR